MAGVNKVHLLGHLGRGPRMGKAGDTPVAQLRLATTSKGKGGKVTEWHTVVAYGKLAERCEKYLEKGREVWVEGSLRTRKYTPKSGKNKGVEMQVTEVVASGITFIDSRSSRGKEE